MGERLSRFGQMIKAYRYDDSTTQWIDDIAAGRKTELHSCSDKLAHLLTQRLKELRAAHTRYLSSESSRSLSPTDLESYVQDPFGFEAVRAAEQIVWDAAQKEGRGQDPSAY